MQAIDLQMQNEHTTAKTVRSIHSIIIHNHITRQAYRIIAIAFIKN